MDGDEDVQIRGQLDHRGADCCSEPALSGAWDRPLSARASRNPLLTEEEREAAEAEAAEWARICSRC